MSNKEKISQNVEDTEYKPTIISRPVTTTFKARIISYFLTLLIPTIGVGGFLYLLKDNLINNSMKSTSITNKSKNSAFVDLLTRDYIKVANMMGIMKSDEPAKKEPEKASPVLNKKAYTPTTNYRPKRKPHKKKYVSTVYKPGETKMKIIIVDKK